MRGGEIRAKRGGGSRRERAERKRDKGMSKKDRREGEQVKGGGFSNIQTVWSVF